MNKTVSAQELSRQLKSGSRLQIVDVRSPGEYNVGHIPGAINIPLEQVEARHADLQSDVVLVCKSGKRASMACARIPSDLANSVILEGGTEAWKQAGHSVVASANSTWALERQVRFGAGLMVLAGTILGATVAPGWFGLAGFVGAGLTFAGLTDICGFAMLLGAMPWNKPKQTGSVEVRA